jgi:hypothetical protein
MARPSATSEVLVDDERVRVTRFDFAPGAEPAGTVTTWTMS